MNGKAVGSSSISGPPPPTVAVNHAAAIVVASSSSPSGTTTTTTTCAIAITTAQQQQQQQQISPLSTEDDATLTTTTMTTVVRGASEDGGAVKIKDVGNDAGTGAPYDREGPSSSASLVQPFQAPPTSPHQQDSPPLELGWTRITKRRRTTTNTMTNTTSTVDTANANELSPETDDDDSDDNGWLLRRRRRCCDDPSCTDLPKDNTTTASVLRGTAVWCLPESTDSNWFQGYLFPSDKSDDDNDNDAVSAVPPYRRIFINRALSNPPWGLLAQTLEVDECLACSNGGYRRVKVSAYPPSRRGHGHYLSLLPKEPPLDLGEADWTGGDMVQLRGSNVTFTPRQVLIDTKAVTLVKQLFQGLWKRLETEALDDERRNTAAANDSAAPTNDASPVCVLDVIPDVAISMGDLELVLPPTLEATEVTAIAAATL